MVPQNNTDPNILEQLPRLAGKNSISSSGRSAKRDADMKIAFRYKNLSTNQNAISQVSKHNHYFDISKSMDHSKVHSCDIKQIDINTLHNSKEGTNDIFR